MNKKTLIILIIIAVLIAGGAWYYLTSQKQPEKYTGPVEEITVAAAEYLTGTLVYVAEDQRFFEKNGLAVTINGYGSGKAAGDALIAGEADISTSADNVFVSNSFEHTDFRVFGTVATRQLKELVARKDAGIAKISDLKGKKIAVKEKSGAEFQLGVFLLVNDVLQQDMEFVYLKPSEMLDAISSKEVDAVFVWDPYLYDMKKELGDAVVSWHGAEDFYFVLLAKEAWLKNNSAAAERFLKAVLEAESYIENNPEEVKEFVKQRFDYTSDYVDYSWPKQKFTVVLEQAMLILFRDQARWRIERGLTDATEVPNYLDYIYLDALEEVKPEAIGITD